WPKALRPIGARRVSIIRHDPKCLSGSRIKQPPTHFILRIPSFHVCHLEAPFVQLALVASSPGTSIRKPPAAASIAHTGAATASASRTRRSCRFGKNDRDHDHLPRKPVCKSANQRYTTAAAYPAAKSVIIASGLFTSDFQFSRQAYPHARPRYHPRRHH